ncbi:efflux RND transporter periplasmic adaptor subunit [Erythrobacter sp. LQ02-29]|uniref:efflux RND transporter periplasmic adaptor subunit n=1 Tax=Erythrobacter sp. LQ02-29 TaxID=2920384 RepID=UPI001F4E4E9B|nr:efflux RND transporter periplasmic adaptor subunit [Erythrobacter sp. LQ02-29]MCP9221172.1 efflux RND transporter periplasmic adaptor subunit [Erythrobacter sp. LQ02-29]
MFNTPFDRYDDLPATARSEEVDSYDFDDAAVAPAPAGNAAPKQGRSGRGWLIALFILIAAVGSWWLIGGATPAPAAMPVPVVTAAAPLQKQVTEWDEFVGRFKATKTVEVRPQVSGQIVRVHFTDGQYVRAGAPLFTIDGRTYRAALAQAQADVARASSALSLSQANLARAQALISEDAIAATEIDRLKAEVRSNRAALQAAQAATAARSIDVGYTTVRAPISGRISDRRIDAGNLVSGGGGDSATLLTTINAVDPVYFEFTGSEALYLKAQREGLSKGNDVEIRLADEPDYRWHGKLDFTDNGLDANSGTIRARAVVANQGGVLAPGLFGRMRLATGGTRSALLVPDTAITTDQTRKQVLVVAKDGTVAARTVELGPQVGSLRVIEKGLKPTDRVIIKGVQMAMPGQKVRAQPGRIEASAPQPRTPEAQPVSRAASATLAS